MTTFSVIVPTYNRESLLPRCLASVRNQTYDRFEIIVSDDGSVDATRNIVDQAARQDARVRYVYQTNRGAGDARNLGATIASGDYLVFLDSDDEVVGGWLAAFAEQIGVNAPAVVCCGIVYMDHLGRPVRASTPRKAGTDRCLLDGLYRSGTFAVRRDVFDAVGGYAPGLPANQHSEFRCRLVLEGRSRGWRANCIEDTLVIAHEHSGPKMRKNDAHVLQSAEYILEHHGALLRETPRTYASWAAACGGAAARLGRFADARRWFWQAYASRPCNLRNLLRFAVACSPLVRDRVWRSAPKPT